MLKFTLMVGSVGLLFRVSRQLIARAAIIFVLSLQLFLTASAAENASVSNANRPIKDKWAVLIGVGDFADPAIPKLKYPAKDAQDFYNFLVTDGHFAKDHVLLLKDEQATKVKILDAFGDGWLPRRVMKDDLVVIFISSHGSPADVAGENFIIAYDSDPNHTYATGIRLQDLAAEVTKRTECDRLVVLLDACHSGSAIIAQKGLQRTHTNFNVDAITGTGQLVITSSSPDEVSWESKRYPNGVFTHRLIESLKAHGEKTTISTAYSQLKNSVQQEVRFDRIASQTPMMASRWRGQDLALCAPATEPRKMPDENQPEEIQTPPVVTPTTTSLPSHAPTRSIFEGEWTGQWSNSSGEAGKDSLVLMRDNQGDLIGTWTGTVPVLAKQLSDTSIELHGRTARREYQAVATLNNGVLSMVYTARRLDAPGGYQGRATFTRRQ